MSNFDVDHYINMDAENFFHKLPVSAFFEELFGSNKAIAMVMAIDQPAEKLAETQKTFLNKIGLKKAKVGEPIAF